MVKKGEEFEEQFLASLNEDASLPAAKKPLNKKKLFFTVGVIGLIVLTFVAVLMGAIKKGDKKQELSDDFKVYVSYLYYGDKDHLNVAEHLGDDKKETAPYVYKVVYPNSANLDAEGITKTEISDSERKQYFINLTEYYNKFISSSNIDIDFTDEEEDDMRDVIRTAANKVSQDIEFLRIYLQVTEPTLREIWVKYAKEGVEIAKEFVTERYTLLANNQNNPLSTTYAQLKTEYFTTQIDALELTIPRHCITDDGDMIDRCPGINYAFDGTELSTKINDLREHTEKIVSNAVTELVGQTSTVAGELRGDSDINEKDDK